MDERIEIPIEVSLSEAGTEVSFNDDDSFSAKFEAMEKISTTNYEDLFNKPIVNGHTVIGDKVGSDYDLQDKMNAITPQDIDNLFYGR